MLLPPHFCTLAGDGYPARFRDLRAGECRPPLLVRAECTVRIEIALPPEHGADLTTLLRKADIALCRAKTSGDRHLFCEGTDTADPADRLRTMQELRAAVDVKEFVLHYQPKVHLRAVVVDGVEALVRWKHPTRGLIYSEDFLGLVEEAGLMRPMTTAILAVALDQVASWNGQGLDLTVAVNLSASSLVDAQLPERIFAMLAERGVQATSCSWRSPKSA